MKAKPILLAGFALGAFAVSGVALVVLTHLGVDARILENQRLAMQRKLAAILPDRPYDNDPLADRIQVRARDRLGADGTQVYRVRDGGQPLAAVLEAVVPDGYAGPIKMLISVLHDGTIGGVRVISHHETPGLGDKIEESKSDWILGFAGRSLSDPPLDRWGVKRDGGAFDQFTGATITPRSIVKAVRNTLLYVQEQGGNLYAPVGNAPASDAARPSAAVTSGAGVVSAPPASAAALGPDSASPAAVSPTPTASAAALGTDSAPSAAVLPAPTASAAGTRPGTSDAVRTPAVPAGGGNS